MSAADAVSWGEPSRDPIATFEQAMLDYAAKGRQPTRINPVALTVDQIIAAAAAVGQVAAAFLAFSALIVSIRTARAQSTTSERLAHDQTSMNERLAHEHSALLFEQVRMQRDSDILRWTERCIEVLSEADTFVASDGAHSFEDAAAGRLAGLTARLSALIDQGRLYFPNETPAKQGADKPEAYRGFRQRILSVLIRAHEELSKAGGARGDGETTVRRGRLIDLRRQFVSEAQIAVDPRRFIALKELNGLRAERGLKVQTGREPEWASGGAGAAPTGKTSR